MTAQAEKGGPMATVLGAASSQERPLPAMLVCDSGPEFTGRALDAWAYRRGVPLHFIPPRSA